MVAVVIPKSFCGSAMHAMWAHAFHMIVQARVCFFMANDTVDGASMVSMAFGGMAG